MKEHTVYAIQHNVTKRIYIGSSINPVNRYYTHMSELKRGKHKSERMLEDYQKYGEDFSYFELETVENGRERVRHPYMRNAYVMKVHAREYEWMKKYNSRDPKYGYNAQDKGANNYFAHMGYPIPYVEGFPEVIECQE